MTHRLVAVLIVFVGTGVLLACPPAFVPTYRAPAPYTPPVVVKEKVVVEQAIIATFVAIPVATPYAAVGYAVPPTPVAAVASPVATAAPAAAPSPCTEELSIVKRRLAALEAQVAQAAHTAAPPAPSGNGPATPPAPASTSYLDVLRSHCAACHSSTADKDGKQFHLLTDAGLLADLTDTQKLRITKRLYDGSMPPKDNKKGVVPLTEPEVTALLNWLTDTK